MKRLTRFILALIIPFLYSGTALCAFVPTPVTMSLGYLKEADNGIIAGIEFQMDEGWHIYWINPGDTGVPTVFSVTGAKLERSYFPGPQRFTIATLNEFGYEKRLEVPLYLLPMPQEKNITVKASFVACRNECLPMELTLDIPIAAVREKSAVPAEYPRLEGRLSRDAGASLLLSVAGVSLYDFFPYDDSVTTYDKPVRKGDGLLLAAKAENSAGVLNGLAKDAAGNFYEVSAKFGIAPSAQEQKPVALIMLFALLGGMLLNLMPCVLPVLSLKAIALVKSGDSSSSFNRKSALAYTFGILVSFLAISLAVISFKKAGLLLGWGFQMQNSYFVAFLAILFFILSLNFAGFFQVGSFVRLRSHNNRLVASFLTGLLVVLASSPCSAPFMGVSIGATLALESDAEIIATFLALGCGLALPYLAISLIPGISSLVPKSGKWMVKVQQFLAFPLMFTVVWLLWVLIRQNAPLVALFSMFSMVSLMLVIWLWKNRFKKTSAVIFIMLAAGTVFWTAAGDDDIIEWEHYSEAAFKEYSLQNRRMFIKFTASWCLTCIVNDKTAFSSPEIGEIFARYGVVPILADWTDRNDEIARLLSGYGRISIPLYVYLDGAGGYEILPQIATANNIIAAVTGREEQP